MQFDPCNIGSIIVDHAKRDPDAASVEQDGKTFSRADIALSAQDFAAFFAQEGIPAKASIALVCVDRVKGFAALIALWSLDAQVLFLDPRQTIEELKAAQESAGVSAIYTDSSSFARRGGFGLLPPQGATDARDINLQFPPNGHDSHALILSSSGTTGVPRFRSVTHASFIQGLAHAGKLLNNAVASPTISVGSLAFGAVLSQWIKVLMQGEFLLSLPLFFRTRDLHHALCRPNIRVAGLPPVIIGDLLDFHSKDGARDRGHVYPHIRTLSSLGGPIAPDALMNAYQTLTPGVRNLYSMTGVGAVSLQSGADILNKPGSVGKPFPQITVRIEDDNGDLQPTGQTGRIIARCDWREGAPLIDTGDMGWLDADGYLFIAGRSAQIASRNSINVSLADIEHDVKKLPSVRDCIAFAALADGSPDDVIFLAVEAREDAEDLKAQIKSSLAAYRRPDKILIRSQLPRTPSNKIALRVLKTVSRDTDGEFSDL